MGKQLRNEMNKHIQPQLIQDYLEGKLSAQEDARVQEYLAAHMEDPEVRRLLDGWFDTCRQETDASGRESLRSTRTRLGLSRRRHGNARLSLCLAFAVAALLLALPFAFRIGYGSRPQVAPVAWNELTVPIAETREVVLPDGTVLTLNAGSRVTWPSEFSGDKREVFLDGEVLAKVARNPEMPFVIHSGEVNVCVYGTTFNFKSYRDASIVEVMLREGSVGMDVPSGENRRELRLTPGDIAQYNREGGDVILSKVSPEDFKTFAEDRSFSFINIPLKDIASSLERSFGTSIIVADERIANQRFLAFFSNGESLEDILRLLARNGNLKITRNGSMVYLNRR